MQTTGKSRLDSIDELRGQIARGEQLDPESILPFYEATDFVADLLRSIAANQSTLLAAGHVTPDILIAADRAGLTVTESFGPSPFVADLERLLARLQSESDVIYAGHPNRVTGVTWTPAELEMIANANPSGCLIIDEELVGYYGESAAGLVERYPHLVVLRSFTAPFGLTSARYGYAVASAGFLTKLTSSLGNRSLPVTARRLIQSTLAGADTLQARLQSVHDESLRIAQALGRLGIQNRITPTDFLLFRVADPVRVGNFLAASKVTVDNLDGYPQLEHYLRYRIMSPTSNDNFIRAMTRAPRDYYHLDRKDTRPVTFRRGKESVLSRSSIHGTDTPATKGRARGTARATVK